nr:MAG TPA: hypothetical protein [Caudoviricetes sp.]
MISILSYLTSILRQIDLLGNLNIKSILFLLLFGLYQSRFLECF